MSDVFFAAVKGFLYTSFAMDLWWMLKSVITFVFRIDWITNLLISFNGRVLCFFYIFLFKKYIFYNPKIYLACQRGVSVEAVFTACHTVHWNSLLKMMTEIKYNPLGKGQMANNCIWPLSKNAHSQLPLITSSYIFPEGPKKKHWHVLCNTDCKLMPCVLTWCDHSLSIQVLTTTLPWQNL